MPETMWKLKGNCGDADPILFDPDAPKEQRAVAKKVYCYRCPVLTECLDSAMVNGEQGVWGGTDDWERARLRTNWLKDNDVHALRKVHENYRAPEERSHSNRGRASVSARYDRRLQMATRLYERLMNDTEAFPQQDMWAQMLELMINNPTKSYDQLAEKFDKGSSWYTRNIGLAGERYGISASD